MSIKEKISRLRNIPREQRKYAVQALIDGISNLYKKNPLLSAEGFNFNHAKQKGKA